MAGELGIPFTTGVLLGIGEGDGDTERTLSVIADIHSKYGVKDWTMVSCLCVSPWRGGRERDVQSVCTCRRICANLTLPDRSVCVRIATL